MSLLWGSTSGAQSVSSTKSKGSYRADTAYWEYGGGAKAWLIFCTFINAANGLLLIGQQNYFGILNIVIAILYALLWLNKNIYAFYIMCAIPIILMIVTFSVAGAVSFLGLIIPFITFLVIRKYYF